MFKRARVFALGVLKLPSRVNWKRAIGVGLGAGILGSAVYAEEERRLGKPALTRNFIADAVEKAFPGLVSIVSRGGWLAEGGSGFIISPDGRIVTNAHVVSNSSGYVMVTLADGQEYQARVIGVDQVTDIALLAIEGGRGPFPYTQLGDSEGLRCGEFVASLGSPFTLRNTVTMGIISAVRREGSELGIPGQRNVYIQTDCPIEPGNSGGPLINIDGEVIGVNTLKAVNTSGISFAIPVNLVKEIIRILDRDGVVRRPYVGISMLTLDKKIVQSERSHSSSFPTLDRGVLITRVERRSPGSVAGLEAGDIILEVNGKQVSSTSDIIDTLGYKVGEKVVFGVFKRRSRKTEHVQVRTSSRI